MPVLGNEDVKRAMSDRKKDSQRKEIARLSIEVERLTKQVRELTFELNKERTANTQLRGENILLRSKIEQFPIGGSK